MILEIALGVVLGNIILNVACSILDRMIKSGFFLITWPDLIWPKLKANLCWSLIIVAAVLLTRVKA